MDDLDEDTLDNQANTNNAPTTQDLLWFMITEFSLHLEFFSSISIIHMHVLFD